MFKYLLYFSLIVPFSGLSQHQIMGTFSPATDFKTTMLYQLSAGNLSYKSYGAVNELGHMKIDLDTSITPGMYKLVYALPQSDHNFEFIYNGKEDVIFNFDRTTGVEFINSKENQLFQTYTQSITAAHYKLMELYAQPTMDPLTYKTRVHHIDSLQQSYEALSKGMIVSHFIVASKPYIPNSVETAKTYIQNAKSHYFKPINFKDTILQSSNFIIDKSIDYILGMHASETPSFEDYKANVDAVYQAFSSTTPSYQLTSLSALNDVLIKSKQEALAVYLTETYALPLATQLKAIEMKAAMETFLRVAIGAKAPNFDIEHPLTAAKTSLYDLKGATTYLLVFWSSDCGHCMNELPEVHSYISNHPNTDIEVIAIGLENTSQPWNEVIKGWPNFIHTIAEGKWENDIPTTYGITVTPSYLVLDASKTITSKPYSLEELKTVLDQK